MGGIIGFLLGGGGGVGLALFSEGGGHCTAIFEGFGAVSGCLGATILDLGAGTGFVDCPGGLGDGLLAGGGGLLAAGGGGLLMGGVGLAEVGGCLEGGGGRGTEGFVV